ncbi:unnamed protein product [Pieris brassicae]|uniref:Uncharacterized protein n=1 Tax=Pieris brassicae TaxID=7116 RepID=A0A9P0T244_PIEBR|nr:unnamed protein product [Pieris brassicae]
MPLLVNALQETSYIDSTSENISTPALRKKKQHSQVNNINPESSHTIYKSIRRTTPRPFIFEYRSPNPTPFSRSFNSRSWVESYRNAQRLKNLNQVIKYLEKTLHAKFGDIYEPSTAQIAFSGVYVAPIKKKIKPVEDCHESQTSQRIAYNSNHLSDPLFVYKPENPGDINLLADGYRFAPTLKSHIRNANNNIPMFRPVNKRKCVGSLCDYSSVAQNSDARETHSSKENKPRAFGVMLDLYPIHSNYDESIKVKSTSPIDKIYFTTVRPSYQFKKKSNHNNMHVRRTSFRPKISKTRDEERNTDLTTTHTSSDIETTTVPQLVVHFNVYSVKKNPSISLREPNSHHTAITTTTTTESIQHDIQLPVITSSNVEDYHAGSSGIIPVQDRTPAPSTYPIITPTITQFDQRYLSTESITTNPPDIIKFSPEDAKVPDEYINFNLRKSDISLINESDLEQKYQKFSEFIEPKLEVDHSSAALNGKEKEEKTLVIKLKNIVGTTTEIPTTETIEYTQEYIEENTTTNEPGDTYVPTINGHYRSSKRKTLSTLFYENSEKYRKKKIETSITLQKSTYVPMYVEIKRNRTITSTENY